MAYRLYQTEGLVLASRPYGEASCLFELLTPDLGLVLALAQGVRKREARFKGHLRVGNLVQLGLIRGREYWRLVSAHDSLGVPSSLFFVWWPIFGRVLSLTRRLVIGEVALPKVFADLKAGRSFLLTDTFTKEELGNYSLLAGARLLTFLGYALPLPETAFSDWAKVNLCLPPERRVACVQEVRRALEASHL